MTVNIKLARVNGTLVPYPTSAPTVVATAIGDLNLYSNTSSVLAYDATTYANAVSYVDGKAYVNTSQLSSNLTNYQTTAGLAANVAILTSNNATYAFGKTENNLNVNNALSSNSSTYLGSANLQNIQTYITSNASAAYTNAVAYVDGKSFVNSSVNVTFTGIHVYSSNVTLNAGLIANGSIGTSGQILKSTGAYVYWADGDTGTVTQINTANGLSGGPITTSGTIEIVANSGIYVNSSGVFVNTGYIATLTSNNTTYAFGKTENNLNVNNALTANSSTYLGSANLQNIQTYITSNASAAYTNAVAYVDGKAYVNTSQLFSNLTNYQTTAGLSANVATLTSNNATYAYGKTEANLNVNNALTANSSTYLGSANLSNIQTYITSNASAAYTNAVSYVDGKAYVNTSQLSSNLANYALLTGATFSGNVRTQQSAQVDGNLVVSGNLTVSGNVVVIGANNLSVVDNMIYLNSNSTVSNPDLGFAGNYNDGVYRHTGFFRDASDGVWKVFDSYLPEPDASPYIDTANSSFHIANFQANIVYVGNTTVYSTVNTTSFSGTANNSTFAYGKTESNLNVNNALTANSSTFVGTANLSNIQTFITSNASAAYTNAVAYVDGKAYVNTSQLSSNLANYQTTAGLAANVATLTANNTSFVGTISAANVVSNAQLASNLANYQTTAGLAANVATLAANSATYANASISNTFTVGTSTYFVSNGNVGIGTNNPTTKLDIAGPIRSYNSKFANGATGTNLILRTNSVVGEISALTFYSTFATGTDINPRRSSDITSGYSTGAWGTEYLSFNVGYGVNDNANTTIERMRITGGGNVGVGNTNPDAKLAVTGTANVSGNVVIGGALTSANLTTSTNTATIGTAAYFVSNGNVGVGTNTPGVKLSIIAPTNTHILQIGGNSQGNLPGPLFGGSFSYNYIAGSRDFGLWNTDTTPPTISFGFYQLTSTNTYSNLMFITSGGNVGIGTSGAVNARLAVTGTANVSGNVAIAGVTTFNANIILGTSGLSANGGFGTAGQVLTSNGTATYWNTAASGGFSNGQSISVNNFVITGSFTANSSNGTAGQVLTSNGTATYWADASGGISTGKAIAMAMIFG